MREKELRLALVCYGGISLAVYMHGMTKEVLKLVRASKALHAHAGAADTYQDSPEASPFPADSENTYYDLLKQIGTKLDLRVVVDIIAGASAGGINACILGRALAHDLDIDPVREFWMVEGGVERLMPEHVKAKPWSKPYLYPGLWLMRYGGVGKLNRDPEFQRNLSMFLRSRWFDAPFDGPNLTRVLYGGMAAMGEPPRPHASLVPAGLKLDLFVTVTNFHGFQTDMEIHDPPVVVERAHRQVLTFSYSQWPRGTEVSTFDLPNLPGLAWAARATSSFPGAFPPAHLGEAQDLVHRHGLQWPGRVEFLYDNFAPYVENNMNPTEAVFIDGSVLNNKPFAAAISAIDGRPAYRQVDRRVVYIEPDPSKSESSPGQGVPGFFATLKGALSDIPRHQPISEDLDSINRFNAQVRRLQATLEATTPHITKLVSDVAGPALDSAPTSEALGDLREAANLEAAERAGFAYEGYLRLKVDALLEDLAEMLAALAGCRPESIQGQRLKRLVQQWADAKGLSPKDHRLTRVLGDGTEPPWVKFLRQFDRQFRLRRVRFVIRQVNELYGKVDAPGFEGLVSDDLDRLKAALYDMLATLPEVTSTSLGNAERKDLAVVSAMASIKGMSETGSDGPPKLSIAEAMDGPMQAIQKHLDLERHTALIDDTIVTFCCSLLPEPAWRLVLDAYVGFPVWDVLTFNLTNWRQLGEFNEIRVDRMSHQEAPSLPFGRGDRQLKGLNFNHFGAFFSRSFRAHDYLWGRLHAMDRLIDIVMDAARLEGAGLDIHVQALKQQAIRNILEAEEEHLPEVWDLIQTLKAEAEEL